MSAVRLAGAAALCLAVAGARPAFAQYPGEDAPVRGSVEISGGGMWAQGFDLDSSTASLSRAATDQGFDLFTAAGRVDGFPGAHARLGVYLSRVVSVEAGARFARPSLSYDLAGDAESADDETAVETLSHYVFDGSVLFHLVNAAFADGSAVPFLSAGGGYVRELHEGNELVETGDEFHATAGLKWWFGGGRRRFGLRVEAGISSRQGGFEAGDERRTLPVALGGLSFVF